MEIRKLFRAEMAHLVPGAYTKRCHYVHGHSYKFELFLEGRFPNDAQMVSDFKGVKDSGINDFFDSFDHAVMMWEKDPLAPMIGKINPERHVLVPFIPTAEMMSKAFYTVCDAILRSSKPLSGEKEVSVSRVVVHETETGYAVFRREDVESDQFPSVRFERWKFSDGIRADWRRPAWYDGALRALAPDAASV